MIDEKVVQGLADSVAGAFGVLPVEGRNLLVRAGTGGSMPLGDGYTLIVLDQFESTTFSVTDKYKASGEKVLVIPTSVDSDVFHDYTLEEVLGVVALVGCDVYAPLIIQDPVLLHSIGDEVSFSEVLNLICKAAKNTLFPFCTHDMRKLETDRSFGKHMLKGLLSDSIAQPPYMKCTTSTYDANAILAEFGDKVVIKNNYGQMVYIGHPAKYRSLGFTYLVVEKFIEGVEGSTSFTVGVSNGKGFVEPLVNIKETNRLNTGKFPGPKFGDTVTLQEGCTGSESELKLTELAKGLLYSLPGEYYGVFDISYIFDGEKYWVIEFSTRFSNSNMGSVLHMLEDSKAYLDLFRNRTTELPDNSPLSLKRAYSIGISLMCFNKAARAATFTKVVFFNRFESCEGDSKYTLRFDPISIVFDTCFYDYLALDGRVGVCTVLPEDNTLESVKEAAMAAQDAILDLHIFDSPVLADVESFIESLT